MKLLNKWAALSLLVVALGLVTAIGTFLPGQADFTGNRMFTLSDGSRNIVAQLDEPVVLQYYFSRSVEGAPVSFKNYASRVENLLEQYARASRGKVRLEVIDPRPDTAEEEAALRAGLLAQPYPTGENVFFGLVAIQADQEEAIPVFARQREGFLEFDISQLIYRVQQVEKPVLGVITSLDMFAGQDSWVVVDQLQHHFEVRRLSGDDVPGEIDLLAVLHPDEFSEELLYDIDQFILSGKPALIAVDPSSYVKRTSLSEDEIERGEGMNTASHMEPLFSAWGIKYDPTRVVGDMEFAASVDTGTGRARYPIWLRIDAFDDAAPPTAHLNTVFFPEAGAFSLEGEGEGEAVRFTPLITSSPRSSRIMTSMLELNDPERVAREVHPDDQPEVIAGFLRGRLSSAFPDGVPGSPGGALIESETASSVILIGDADFLADEFSVQVMDYGRQRAYSPVNDNLAFFSNALEYLAGSEELIGLRGKGTAVRSFDRVREMEAAAQERYQEHLIALEERLDQVRAQLEELQGKPAEQGSLVFSPEVEEAVEGFRREEAAIQGEQREIRKKLREDIEGMKLRLAMFNLLTGPTLILIAGIAFFVVRHRRTRISSQAL